MARHGLRVFYPCLLPRGKSRGNRVTSTRSLASSVAEIITTFICVKFYSKFDYARIAIDRVRAQYTCGMSRFPDQLRSRQICKSCLTHIQTFYKTFLSERKFPCLEIRDVNVQ